MQETCVRCGSEKLIPRVPVLDRYGGFGGLSKQARVEMQGNPRAWIFKDMIEGQLEATICGECGHAEFYVTNFRELYSKYEQSRLA